MKRLKVGGPGGGGGVTYMDIFKEEVSEKRGVERGVVSHQSGHLESLWCT